jgi:tetratricopeptide (TPR) repeat protein
MARFSTSSLLFFLLVLTVASAPADAQNAQDADRLIARAIELHNAGDVLGAIESYTAALAIQPDRADALSNLGAAYVRLGQYDDAIKQYELALKSDPASTAIRLNLALAYYKSARPNQAIPQLKRVVSSDPQAKGAYLLLADCYLQTGQAKDAASLLRPREPMFGDDLSFAYLLGTALVSIDETVDGQKYVDRVFRAGESAEAHLLMGTAFLARQDYPAARIELEQAVKLNPKLPTVHSLYGRALFAMGDHEAAEREFRKELELNVNDYEANLQLGNMRKSAEKFTEAETYLERATTIRPDDLAGRKLLANLRLQTGKTEEAVQILEAIVKDNPNLVDVHVQLATAYNRLKRKDDADRERAIIDRLNAEAQAKQPGSKPGGGSQP